jgi:hypothetical protein
MLQLAGIALIFMFMPVEDLPESLRASWSLIGDETPAWAWIGFNLLAWGAMTLIGPFYSGAGFGLYLNRRTQLEAWDVEIAFRRLRERLARLAPLMVLFLLVGIAPLRAQQSNALPDSVLSNHKETAAPSNAIVPATPHAVFGQGDADTDGFRQAAARAYEDPQLGAKRTVDKWVFKERDKPTQDNSDQTRDPSFMTFVSQVLALIGESILWIVLAALLIVLALTARWWLPWLRGSGRRTREAQTPVQHDALLVPEVLPPDILGSARRLWREGKPRHALALLYRASVEVLGQRADIVLPPGATEAQCLRASRRMPQEADRTLFARMVRTWQYAAYAGRLPSEDEFEALMGELHRQYGWRT